MSNRSINYKLQFSKVFCMFTRPGSSSPTVFCLLFSWQPDHLESVAGRQHSCAQSFGGYSWQAGSDLAHMDWLVVWNMNFIFPIILGISIHPNWLSLHHFSEGLVYSTTNQYCYPFTIPLLSIENHIKAILKPYIWNHQPDMFSHSNPTKDPKSWGSPKSP